jgi:hypothetical protein
LVGFLVFSQFAVILIGNSSAADPPFFEPKEGYYQARGTRVTAVWSVDRTELPEDGVLTATLTIRGATNPHEIVRPDLRKLQAFTDSFRSIQDVPGMTVTPTASQVTFTYLLRPRDRTVTRLPSLDFFFLNPAVKNRNPFENARVKGLDLVVTLPAPRPPPPPVPMAESDQLFEVTTGPRVLGREPLQPGLWAWVALLAAGPLVAVVWLILWRFVYPDAARLARLRRGRAARRATDAIRRAGRSADPSGAVTAAVRGYLRSRFPLPIGAETPSEVGDALKAAGVPEADSEVVAGFFRRADAARFGAPSDTGVSLADEAAALIGRLEAVE